MLWVTDDDDDYPIIYRVLTIPGGCLEFLPSTVATSARPLPRGEAKTPTNGLGFRSRHATGAAEKFHLETSGGVWSPKVFWSIKNDAKKNKHIMRGPGKHGEFSYPFFKKATGKPLGFRGDCS